MRPHSVIFFAIVVGYAVIGTSIPPVNGDVFCFPLAMRTEFLSFQPAADHRIASGKVAMDSIFRLL